MTRPADNPFRMDRIEAIPFEPQDLEWSALVNRLEALSYRAAIVGPHGSGKTTLLDHLEPHLTASGFGVRRLTLRQEAGKRLPLSWRTALANAGPQEIVLADGYDLLAPPGRGAVLRRSRRLGGLLVTAHRPTRLPTLITCQTTPDLLQHIVTQLLGYSLPAERIETLYHRHAGNVRNALRELYDAFAQEERDNKGP